MADDDLEIRVARLEEQRAGDRYALQLQATEYERRLGVLNHAHEQAVATAAVTVTRERFEQYAKTEAEKRELALARVDEKFEDYVKRYEVRQREVDQALTLMKGAAEQAQRAVEEQARKTNRNVAFLGLGLALLVAAANYLGSI